MRAYTENYYGSPESATGKVVDLFRTMYTNISYDFMFMGSIVNEFTTTDSPDPIFFFETELAFALNEGVFERFFEGFYLVKVSLQGKV